MHIIQANDFIIDVIFIFDVVSMNFIIILITNTLLSYHMKMSIILCVSIQCTKNMNLKNVIYSYIVSIKYCIDYIP